MERVGILVLFLILEEKLSAFHSVEYNLTVGLSQMDFIMLRYVPSIPTLRRTFYHEWIFSSVQFSHSVVSDSLRPHGLQHARPPCLLPTPGVYSNSIVHWADDAIQPSHPLSSPSPPAFNVSQHQGLFKWVSSSHQVAKVLEFQFQHQSFQWMFRTDFLYRMDWLDLLAVQGTLKSLLHHHSSEVSILHAQVSL